MDSSTSLEPASASSVSASASATASVSTPNSPISPDKKVDNHGQKYFVQIVDGHGNFSTTESKLTELVAQASHEDPTNNDSYAIVGIMGCQSTGKSTLLNLLFGTQFREMESSRGRSQTTLGVWLDSASNSKNTVVMDLEGTDSGERGEDRTTFERQTCLFAMALAEVLIINMWEHDIGRYTAANYGILKTVFEVNLQLFRTATKAVLLFLVRDHIEEESPFENLKNKLKTDIGNIWKEAVKPEELKDAKISDYFDMEFVALPHMKLAKTAFYAGVDALRKRFVQQSDPEYFFRRPYHGKKAVPADGFPHYAKTIWETIRSNKDLNLPSQKEMLATYRCDEISAVALNHFFEQLKPLKLQVEAGFVQQFGSTADSLLRKALDSYDKVASKYAPDIVNEKRKTMTGKIGEELFRMVTAQMKHAAKDILERFGAALAEKFGADDKPNEKFFKIVDDLRTDTVNRYKLVFEASSVPLLSWSFDTFEKDLSAKLDDMINIQRTSQLDKVAAAAIASASSTLSTEVSSLVKVGSDDLWLQIAKSHSQTLSLLMNNVQVQLEGLRSSETEKITVRKNIKTKVTEVIRSQIVHQVEMIGLTMRSRFEKLFRQDESGLPRRFSASDDVRTLFVNAKEKALKLLDLFSVFQLPGVDLTDDIGNLISTSPDFKEMNRPNPADDPRNIIMSEGTKRERESEFMRAVEGALIEAEAERDRRVAAGKYPVWMLVAVGFLGFDELMWVLRNPFLLLFLVLLGCVAYAIHMMNMWGPVRMAAEKAMNAIATQETLAAVLKALSEAMANAAQRAQGVTQPTASPSSPSNDKDKDKDKDAETKKDK